MILTCPDCKENVDPARGPCPLCGCDAAILARILESAFESIQLSLEALHEGRVQDALDFAYEAWGLKNSREASAVGLISALAMQDPLEVRRWSLRRLRE